MAKKIKFPPPKEDIPAWFMTYSDVITLLMTFFILLLTFSTTEPERFEKSISTIHSTGGATGLTGEPIDGPVDDSWINRVRPPAARIALRGAEMPPIMRDPVQQSFGKGLKSLDPKKDHNEMTGHFFDVELTRIFNSKDEITSQGKLILKTLSKQLQALPFQVSFQYTQHTDSERIVKLLDYLFREEGTRPGQVGMSIIKNKNLDDTKLRILIRRTLEDRHGS